MNFIENSVDWEIFKVDLISIFYRPLTSFVKFRTSDRKLEVVKIS